MAVPAFPSGEGEKADCFVTLDNPAVTLAAFRKVAKEDAWLLRLFESTGSAQPVRITLKQADGKKLEKAVEAGPFEVKTFRYEPKAGTLEECGIFGKKDE